MSNTKLNCCKCGKEFEITERVYTCGTLWQCEECEIKQMQENAEKDKTISDLETKLAESEEEKNYYQDLYFTSVKGQEKLKQQLAEKEKQIAELEEHDEIYHNQLAIEQLKLIKEKAMEQRDIGWTMRYKDRWDIIMDIDNQIKAIKGDEVV